VLLRVLEPEVMDTEEDAREYAAIDNTRVNQAFVDEAVELAPARGRVLDLGCGPGDIAVLLAQRCPGLEIVAVDLAEEMLRIARRRVVEAGLVGRVSIASVDAKATDFPSRSFDLVLCNSLAHHIPDPLGLLVEVERIAAEGAGLLLKDLVRPETLADWRDLVTRYAAEDTPRQRQLFADSLRAALTLDEVRQLCREARLEGVEIAKVSDRHWVVKRRART
jgi:ubiquinone/menaquinone biosynthesis C-methylase UbiE